MQPAFDDLPGDIGGLLFRMNQELTCPICLCLLSQSTSTPCGHTYCRHCIVHSLETLSKCPICKEAITKRGLSASESVEAIVNEFLILRQHYEADNDINLSQLATREYNNNPRDDLSLQFPYPSKPISTANENTVPGTKSGSKITAVIPESSTTGQAQPSMGMGQRDTSDNRHQPEAIPCEETTEEQKQNSPSTLSLLLWPPYSPLPETSSSKQEQVEAPSSPQSSTPTTSISNTSSSQPLVYVANQMDPFTVTYLGKLHKDGKLKLAKEAHVSSKVTHFVFSTAGGRGIQNVTGSYLQALVLRKWIVNEQWVHQCYKSNRVVDAAPFGTFYYGNGQEDYRNGPKQARCSAQNKEPPLFHTKVVYFDDSVDVKMKKQFTNLMIAGGGQVIQDTQDMTPSTVILAQSLSKKKDERLVATVLFLYGKQPTSIAWMTQSILRYKLLNEEEFGIGTMIGWIRKENMTMVDSSVLLSDDLYFWMHIMRTMAARMDGLTMLSAEQHIS